MIAQWNIRRMIGERGTRPNDEIAADVLLYVLTPVGSVAGMPGFGAALQWTGNPVNARFFSRLRGELYGAVQQYSEDHAFDAAVNRAAVVDETEERQILFTDDDIDVGVAGVTFSVRRLDTNEILQISAGLTGAL